jgi:hypothetical protein
VERTKALVVVDIVSVAKMHPIASLIVPTEMDFHLVVLRLVALPPLVVLPVAQAMRPGTEALAVAAAVALVMALVAAVAVCEAVGAVFMRILV